MTQKYRYKVYKKVSVEFDIIAETQEAAVESATNDYTWDDKIRTRAEVSLSISACRVETIDDEQPTTQVMTPPDPYDDDVPF